VKQKESKLLRDELNGERRESFPQEKMEI